MTNTTNLFAFINIYADYIIFSLLGLMSFIAIWKIIERILFYRTIKLNHYTSLNDLDLDLTKNLTTLSIIGMNAPYVGLLGTVVGILLTFYTIGQSSEIINPQLIMLNLSFALKATALGIIIAVPTVASYNAFCRKTEVLKTKWQTLNQ